MKIRDSHAVIEGDENSHDMPSGGLDVISDDGRALFTLRLSDGVLEIRAWQICKHDGRVLDDKISLHPRSANCIEIRRPDYE